MNSKIELEAKYMEIIKPIVEPITGHLYAFGSRVRGNASKFSDLDLCYKGKFDRKLIRSIKEKLRNSNLPIKVDLIDYNDCSDEFKSLIDNELIKFQVM